MASPVLFCIHTTAEIKKRQLTIRLRTEACARFHESKHLEEFLKLGKEAYTNGMKRTGGSPADDLIRTYKREKHVYDEVLKNSKKFNEAELDHAKWIIDDAIEKGERAGINLNEL